MLNENNEEEEVKKECRQFSCFPFGHDILTFYVIEIYMHAVASADNNKHPQVHTGMCNMYIEDFSTPRHFNFNFIDIIKLNECRLICVGMYAQCENDDDDGDYTKDLYFV